MTAPAAIEIVGTITPGLGEAAGFTEIDWVKAAFVARLGIDPWPGTLNLTPLPSSRPVWHDLCHSAGIRIPAGQDGFCDARAWHATVSARDGAETRPAAILLPEVPGYPEDKIELIAAVHLCGALELAPGDRVWLRLSPPTDD